MIHTHKDIDLSAINETLLQALARGPRPVENLGDPSQPAPLWLAALFSLAEQGKVILYCFGPARREKIHVALPENFPAGVTCYMVFTSPAVAKKLEFTLTSYASQTEARRAGAALDAEKRNAELETFSEVEASQRQRRELAIIQDALGGFNAGVARLAHQLRSRAENLKSPDEVEYFWKRENASLLHRRRNLVVSALRRAYSGKEPSEELLDRFAPVNVDEKLVGP